jgi:D-tyrosyl-tRNA(Tyr) deacylase
VAVEGVIVGACDTGLVVLTGVSKDDVEADAKRLADRIAKLRIFNDAEGKLNLALDDVGGEVLAISNFTVYGETAKNRRPSFAASAGFDKARDLFDLFVARMKELDVPVQTGTFGAQMEVELINDGPVTVIVES